MLSKLQRGFSLIELMIAMVIGLFVLSGILTLMSNNMAFNKTAIDSLKLSQETKAAMNIMAEDLRRAGYWSNSNCMIPTSPTPANCPSTPPSSMSNPYAHPNWPMTVTAGNCIIFSYDRDGVTTNNVPSSSEKFGYALVNNAIVLGYPTTKDDCLDNSITSGWQTITDPKSVKITNLTLSLTPTAIAIPNSNDVLCIREVQISISAELLKDASVKTTLVETIRVRNDEVRHSTPTYTATCA